MCNTSIFFTPIHQTAQHKAKLHLLGFLPRTIARTFQQPLVT